MFTLSFTDDIQWLPAYQRNNKANKQKNIRCFPNHTPGMGHQEGWCGHTVKVNVKYNKSEVLHGSYGGFDSNLDTLAAFAEFAEAESKGYSEGEVIPYETITAKVRNEKNPLLPLMQGLPTSTETFVDGTVKTGFEFNRALKGWHYGFLGSKLTRNYYHVMRVYLMKLHLDPRSQLGTYTVIAVTQSPPWQLYCRRRIRGSQGAIKQLFVEKMNLDRESGVSMMLADTLSGLNSYGDAIDDDDGEDDSNPSDFDMNPRKPEASRSSLARKRSSSSSETFEEESTENSSSTTASKRARRFAESQMSGSVIEPIASSSIASISKSLDIKEEVIDREANNRTPVKEADNLDSEIQARGVLSMASPSQIADHRFGFLTSILKMIDLPLPLPFLKNNSNDLGGLKGDLSSRKDMSPPHTLNLRDESLAETFGDRIWTFCLHWYDLDILGWSPRSPRNVAALDEEMRFAAYAMQQQEFSDCIVNFVKVIARLDKKSKKPTILLSASEKVQVTSYFLQLLQRIFSSYWLAILQQYHILLSSNESGASDIVTNSTLNHDVGGREGSRENSSHFSIENAVASAATGSASSSSSYPSSSAKPGLLSPLIFSAEKNQSEQNNQIYNRSPGVLSGRKNIPLSGASKIAAATASSASKDGASRSHSSDVENNFHEIDFDIFSLEFPDNMDYHAGHPQSGRPATKLKKSFSNVSDTYFDSQNKGHIVSDSKRA